MFRILIVDDDPVSVQLLRELMKNVHRPHELHVVGDGVEALDYLHCREPFVDAPRPNLILLDMNMPRLSGLEALAALKSDSELRIIPVIIFSSIGSPEEVRKSYQSHANCYVQKPTNLEDSLKFVQAIEAFWMDFALLPSSDSLVGAPYPADYALETLRPAAPPRSGTRIAPEPGEATSRATDDSPVRAIPAEARGPGCGEYKRLLDDFGNAVQELLRLHEQQFRAIIEGDTESQRFDLLIHMTTEKKQLAKYAYLLHVESHGCANADVTDET